uniref:Mediator of RNA polymerase II transcription subunit 20 n=1 Tax=Steinernema glaseri TaxID=37863 RepID=A0A1I7XZR0_9BILA
MVGVAWVFEVPRLASAVDSALEQIGADKIGHYTVDCTPYNPSEGVQGSVQSCYLLHHSYCPESSFIQCGMVDSTKRTAATADRGFDLVLSKLSKGLTPDTPGKFEVTGNEYKIADFYIRVGAALMNSVSKGVIVEVEYAASALPSQCGGLLMEAVEQLFPELKREKPKIFSSHQEYIMCDTIEQYLKIFQDMRKKAT